MVPLDICVPSELTDCILSECVHLSSEKNLFSQRVDEPQSLSPTFSSSSSSCSTTLDKKYAFFYDDDTVPLVDEPTASTAMCSESDSSAGNAPTFTAVTLANMDDCYMAEEEAYEPEFTYTGPKAISVAKNMKPPSPFVLQVQLDV